MAFYGVHWGAPAHLPTSHVRALILELLFVTSQRHHHGSCLQTADLVKLTFPLDHPSAPLQHLGAAAQAAHPPRVSPRSLLAAKAGWAPPSGAPAGTLRLMSGKPCPGAGGLAGLGPLVAFLGAGDAVGDAFRLKGFSLQEDWRQ